MFKSKKVQIFKIIILIIAIVIIAVATIKFFPFMSKLSTSEGQIAFKEKLDSLGIGSVIVLFVIQIIQMFLAIIPGGPVEVIAGMCYGAVKGTIFIIISSILVSLIIFELVSKFGKKLIYSFCNEKTIYKIEHSKVFQNPKKVEKVMMILFLLPGTPKDLLTYAAGLLPIKPSRFILISIIARIPTIIASTYGGSKIKDGNWKIVIIANLIVFAIAVIAIFIYNKFDKDKIAEKALKTMDTKWVFLFKYAWIDVKNNI